ncbi:MAG: hypothetical protein MZU91_10355 [Desulfosudis oleivorans]|nr:hypothetical protein [Desulfosudis oleivorans]
MDSMVAHYTPARNGCARDDAYTPGNRHGVTPEAGPPSYIRTRIEGGTCEGCPDCPRRHRGRPAALCPL